MLTMIAPILAVANCTTIHSAWFIAQMPTRSPFSTPRPMSARATSFTLARNSRYVQRMFWWTETIASFSGYFAAMWSIISPIVIPKRGNSDVPHV